MKKTFLILIVSSVTFVSAFAQGQLFLEAFEEFSTSRLWDFEQIRIDWKMEGLLQADLNEGLNHLFEKNPKLAEVSFTSVIEQDPKIWQAYYYRSAARKQMQKFRSAEDDIKKALALRGSFYEAYVELGKIQYLSGNILESEQTIIRAIRMAPKQGAAHYIKGDINLTQNERRRAINNYEDCLAADSMFHDARIKIALIDGISRNNIDAALQHLDKVLQYDSLQKSALLFKSILNAKDNKQQAVKDFTRLLTVSPNNVMVLFYRGLFSAQLEDFEKAFIDFHSVIKLTSTDDNNFVGKQSFIDKKIDLQNAGAYVLTRVYGLPEEDGLKIRQAYCQILTGDYDKSLAVLDQVSTSRKEPLAVYLKAVAYEHKGLHIKAAQQYSMALGLDDQIADAYKKRGIYLQEMKQWDNAVADFNAVLTLTPDAFITNRMRGVSYYHLNRYDEALADFNLYLKKDSTNKEVQGFRGMAYLKLNKRLNAYTDFGASGNAVGINFGDAEKLIDSVLHLKDTTQALHALTAITSAAPYFTEGYVKKFQIHVARNEWKLIEDKITTALRNSRADATEQDHSYLLTLQAIVYSRNRHTEDAIKTLTEAIKFDKDNAFAYLERGRIFQATGKTSKAESDFKKASSLGNQQAKKMLATLGR